MNNLEELKIKEIKRREVRAKRDVEKLNCLNDLLRGTVLALSLAKTESEKEYIRYQSNRVATEIKCGIF